MLRQCAKGDAIKIRPPVSAAPNPHSPRASTSQTAVAVDPFVILPPAPVSAASGPVTSLGHVLGDDSDGEFQDCDPEP